MRVWGTATSAPSVEGERGDSRSPPMRLTLVGSESSPLVIRRVAAAPVVAVAEGRALPPADPR